MKCFKWLEEPVCGFRFCVYIILDASLVQMEVALRACFLHYFFRLCDVYLGVAPNYFMIVGVNYGLLITCARHVTYEIL